MQNVLVGKVIALSAELVLPMGEQGILTCRMAAIKRGRGAHMPKAGGSRSLTAWCCDMGGRPLKLASSSSGSASLRASRSNALRHSTNLTAVWFGGCMQLGECGDAGWQQEQWLY